MNFVSHLLLLLSFLQFSNVQSAVTWGISVQYPNGTKRVFHIPIQQDVSESSPSDTDSLCRHCFYFRTVDGGRRMLVEPCGGPNCIALVNSTTISEVLPTIPFQSKQCGQIQSPPVSPRAKSGIQLKVSTSEKNTLRPAEYPWLVRIESRSYRFSRTVTLCGGTLIHPQWVLTAAHCMFDSKTDRLYPTNGIDLHLGNYHRLRASATSYTARPAYYIIHPKFRISRQSPAPVHDLALLRLAKPVPMSRSIGSACLPEQSDRLTEGTLAYTAGWGHSEPDSSAVNEPRKARIKIAPRSCRQLMIDPRIHICGRNDRGNNICNGDSGSGLFVRAGVKSSTGQTEWKWHVFGVASFGLAECSTLVNHDNAFASVPVDVDWIHEMIKTY